VTHANTGTNAPIASPDNQNGHTAPSTASIVDLGDLLFGAGSSAGLGGRGLAP
jgi:hypothetical protein